MALFSKTDRDFVEKVIPRSPTQRRPIHHTQHPHKASACKVFPAEWIRPSVFTLPPLSGRSLSDDVMDVLPLVTGTRPSAMYGARQAADRPGFSYFGEPHATYGKLM